MGFAEPGLTTAEALNAVLEWQPSRAAALGNFDRPAWPRRPPAQGTAGVPNCSATDRRSSASWARRRPAIAQLGRRKAGLQEGLEWCSRLFEDGSAPGRRGPAHHLLVQRPRRVAPGWAEVDLLEGDDPAGTEPARAWRSSASRTGVEPQDLAAGDRVEVPVQVQPAKWMSPGWKLTVSTRWGESWTGVASWRISASMSTPMTWPGADQVGQEQGDVTGAAADVEHLHPGELPAGGQELEG